MPTLNTCFPAGLQSSCLPPVSSETFPSPELQHICDSSLCLIVYFFWHQLASFSLELHVWFPVKKKQNTCI